MLPVRALLLHMEENHSLFRELFPRLLDAISAETFLYELLAPLCHLPRSLAQEIFVVDVKGVLTSRSSSATIGDKGLLISPPTIIDVDTLGLRLATYRGAQEVMELLVLQASEFVVIGGPSSLDHSRRVLLKIVQTLGPQLLEDSCPKILCDLFVSYWMALPDVVRDPALLTLLQAWAPNLEGETCQSLEAKVTNADTVNFAEVSRITSDPLSILNVDARYVFCLKF